MRLTARRRVVPSFRSAFAGFRFPPEVITVAVRWYLRFGLSYRDVEELLAERGVQVDHVTVYRWVHRFTPLLADAARPCRHAPGDRWFVDESLRQRSVGRRCPRFRARHPCHRDGPTARSRDGADRCGCRRSPCRQVRVASTSTSKITFERSISRPAASLQQTRASSRCRPAPAARPCRE